VGIDKFAFDVWGDTVNFAARLEATSLSNNANISETTYLRVKDFFTCEPRGRVKTKEGREYDMYFVRGLHPELTGPGSPPAPFADRYRIYYQHPPRAFPSVLASSPVEMPLRMHAGDPQARASG
jgi:adenylate cyclase